MSLNNKNLSCHYDLSDTSVLVVASNIFLMGGFIVGIEGKGCELIIS